MVCLVQSKAQAQAGIKNPLIGSVLQSVKAETGEEGAFALPKMPYEYGALGKFRVDDSLERSLYKMLF